MLSIELILASSTQCLLGGFFWQESIYLGCKGQLLKSVTEGTGHGVMVKDFLKDAWHFIYAWCFM